MQKQLAGVGIINDQLIVGKFVESFNSKDNLLQIEGCSFRYVGFLDLIFTSHFLDLLKMRNNQGIVKILNFEAKCVKGFKVHLH